MAEVGVVIEAWRWWGEGGGAVDVFVVEDEGGGAFSRGFGRCVPYTHSPVIRRMRNL